MGTYLDSIVSAHRERAAADRRSTSALLDGVDDLDPCRDLCGALRDGSHLAVIAEIKRRSPSKGDLAADLVASEMARTYEGAGASAISVLTDAPHFGGSAEDLSDARGAVSVPVLRKDFTVSPNDVLDARLMGADAVLLIVAALDDAELADFAALSHEIGLATLVETHDEAEVERALLHASPRIIGVNQRDLSTFEVDTRRAVRVARHIPDDVVAVAESGVDGSASARTLADAGYHAVLVGEYLVTAADAAPALSGLAVERIPG